MKTVIPKSPKMDFIGPIWWHPHGMKMQVKGSDENSLTIAGSAAKIVITRESGSYPGWFIDWAIQHSGTTQASGRTFFLNDELKAAFGLTDESGDYGDLLIERYGGDSANQGQYIRSNIFLNIPCPGTGHDGDPNVSIEIDDSIKRAVQKLLG